MTKPDNVHMIVHLENVRKLYLKHIINQNQTVGNSTGNHALHACAHTVSSTNTFQGGKKSGIGKRTYML